MTCLHEAIIRNGNEFLCMDCGTSFGKMSVLNSYGFEDPPEAYDPKNFCQRCGKKLEDLLLFTSWVKICRACDDSKATAKEAGKKGAKKLDLGLDGLFDDTDND